MVLDNNKVLLRNIRVGHITWLYYNWRWDDSIYIWEHAKARIRLKRYVWTGSRFKRPKTMYEIDLRFRGLPEKHYHWAKYWDPDFPTFMMNLGLEVPERRLHIEDTVPCFGVYIKKILSQSSTVFYNARWITFVPGKDISFNMIYYSSFYDYRTQKTHVNCLMAEIDNDDNAVVPRGEYKIIKSWLTTPDTVEMIMNALSRNDEAAADVYTLLN